MGKQKKDGTSIIGGKEVRVETLEPTTSDKNSEDLIQKLRYLIDQLDNTNRQPLQTDDQPVGQSLDAQTTPDLNWREWGEREGQGINQVGYTSGIADGVSDTVVSYTISAGKTLYIDSFSFGVDGTGAIICTIYNDTTAINYVRQGGNAGGGLSFAKPIAVGSDGDTLQLNIANYTGAARDAWGSMLGREI